MRAGNTATGTAGPLTEAEAVALLGPLATVMPGAEQVTQLMRMVVAAAVAQPVVGEPEPEPTIRGIPRIAVLVAAALLPLAAAGAALTVAGTPADPFTMTRLAFQMLGEDGAGEPGIDQPAITNDSSGSDPPNGQVNGPDEEQSGSESSQSEDGDAPQVPGPGAGYTLCIAATDHARGILALLLGIPATEGESNGGQSDVETCGSGTDDTAETPEPTPEATEEDDPPDGQGESNGHGNGNGNGNGNGHSGHGGDDDDDDDDDDEDDDD